MASGGQKRRAFLGLLYVQEVNAEPHTHYLLVFLEEKATSLNNLRVWDLMEEHQSVWDFMLPVLPVSIVMPSTSWPLCSVNEHCEVKGVLGTLLTVWNAFYCSPRKQKKWLKSRSYSMHLSWNLASQVILSDYPESDVCILPEKFFRLWFKPLNTFPLKMVMQRHMAFLKSCVHITL